MSVTKSVNGRDVVQSTTVTEDSQSADNHLDHQTTRPQLSETTSKTFLDETVNIVDVFASQFNFKDRYLTFACACGMFGFAIFASALPMGAKFLFGKRTRTFGLPFIRLLVELSSFMFLYLALRGQKQQPPQVVSSKPVIESNTTAARNGCRVPVNESVGSNGSLIGNLLRRPVWNILVKLNYSLMLTHFTIARYLIQSQVQLLTFSWLNYLQHSTFLILLSYLVCCIMHLTIEMPLTSLIKLLFNKWDCCKASEKRQS